MSTDDTYIEGKKSTHNRMKADTDWPVLFLDFQTDRGATFVFEVYFGPTDNDWNLQFIRNADSFREFVRMKVEKQ